MKLPVIRGVIERRILVNYRVEPNVLAALLPKPFRPKVVHGCGIAGICLIRLKHIRPRFFPARFGIASENAAHRIAVEWEQGGTRHEGVFVARRDTSSRLNALAGGRLFPGAHHHASFSSQEQGDHYRVSLDSDDNRTHVTVAAHLTDELPCASMFRSLDEASEYFQQGSLGYSATSRPDEFEGLELRAFRWSVKPLAIEQVESSYFSNQLHFPPGSVEFDCALLMKNIEHEWHARESIRTPRRGAEPLELGLLEQC